MIQLSSELVQDGAWAVVKHGHVVETYLLVTGAHFNWFLVNGCIEKTVSTSKNRTVLDPGPKLGSHMSLAFK